MKFAQLFFAAAVLFAVAGCQEKKIVDVETPAGGVEVTENESTGAVTVDVEGKE